MSEKKSKSIADKVPKAVIWLESSMTALHIMHMAQLSCAMQAKGFEVVILTSEDTLKKFAENKGKINLKGYCLPSSAINFGPKARFLTTLASQISYSKFLVIIDKNLTPFEFIGSKPIQAMRKEVIEKAISEEKPDALIISLWPSGYGPFTAEIKNMINKARRNNPNCQIYSLSNDIPYLGDKYNNPKTKAPYFDLVDRTLIRGDGSIEMRFFMPLTPKAAGNISYVGHFINPLPPRTQMPDRDRKVIVTYGTRESGWDGNMHSAYFTNIAMAAPRTKLRNQPWEFIIGPSCSKHGFGYIQQIAESASRLHNMRISVRRGIPDEAFRQATADAIFRIAQYDPFVLDDVSTGVPALISTGNIGVNTCGANEGDDRLMNLEDIDAPIVAMDQNALVPTIISYINDAWKKAKGAKYSLSSDAPAKAAELIVADYRSKHPSLSQDEHPIPAETPDPVLKLGRATPQAKARSHAR